MLWIKHLGSFKVSPWGTSLFFLKHLGSFKVSPWGTSLFFSIFFYMQICDAITLRDRHPVTGINRIC
jgi:hypothetical protein